MALDQPAVARRLCKTPGAIGASVIELASAGVCTIRGNEIEIADRFWPYERQQVRAGEGHTEFVRLVRDELMRPACVNSAFTPADEELAIGLHRRGVSLELVRRAVWLCCARKYISLLNNESRERISSLGYFIPAVDEVSGSHFPDSYWEHIRRKAAELERRWLARNISGEGEWTPTDNRQD